MIYFLKKPFFSSIPFGSFAAFMLLFLSSLNQGINAKEAKIWQTSILKAMEIAKKEDKPIFLELYADWCTICKTLEKTILPDAQVQSSLENYILVRLNGEEYPNLMERYDVQGFPTLLFLDKYANFIQKLSGMPSKELLVREAKLAYKNSNIEKKLQTVWRKDPNSAQANFDLGVYYYQKEQLSTSIDYFNKASQNAQKNDLELQRQSKYNIALITMNLGKYDKAILHWDQYTNAYAKAPQIAGAFYHRGICHKETQQIAKAKLDFKKAIELSNDEEEKKLIQSEWKSLPE